MQISVKTRYAICALIDLNINHHERNVKLKDISARQNIPLKYLEQIIQILSKSNIVKGERGPNGGYVLARPAYQISLNEVILALDGNTGIDSAFDPGMISVEGSSQKVVYDFWKNVETELEKITRGVTIADLSVGVRQDDSKQTAEYFI